MFNKLFPKVIPGRAFVLLVCMLAFTLIVYSVIKLASPTFPTWVAVPAGCLIGFGVAGLILNLINWELQAMAPKRTFCKQCKQDNILLGSDGKFTFHYAEPYNDANRSCVGSHHKPKDLPLDPINYSQQLKGVFVPTTALVEAEVEAGELDPAISLVDD